MKHVSTLIASLLLPVLALLVTACEKPDATGQPKAPAPPKPATEEKPDPVDKSGAFESSTNPKTKDKGEEDELPEEVDCVLDVHMSDDKILITGHLRSKYQEKDLLRILAHNFPDYEVVSELDVGYHVEKIGGWGNRVTGALLPLFKTTGPGGRFRYEGGTVTLEGNVPTRPSIQEVHRAVAYYMESPEVTNWDVKLEVAK